MITGVAFDYFHNGRRDLLQHFEYAYGGAVGPTATDISNGTWHVDIPWNGERDGIGKYRDMLLTVGADPFVFGMYLVANEETVGVTWPEGVLDDGELLGLSGDVVSAQHGLQSVTSYASFEGSQAQGVLYLETVSINSATCAVISGRGKKSAREQVRRVSVDYTIKFGSDGTIPSDQFAWVGLHLRDAGSGYLSKHLSFRPSQARVSGSFTRDLPADDAIDLELEFLVDYVNPTGILSDYAYDPARGNSSVETTLTCN